MRAIDAGVDQRIQSSDGRQVGHAGESSTILPFAFGSHFTNSVLSLNFGSTIASARHRACPWCRGSTRASSPRASARAARRDRCATRRAASRATCRTARASRRCPTTCTCLITQSLAARDARAAGEARSDRVEERLRELLDVRAVHAEAPDALQRRVVGGKVRRLLCGGDAGERDGRE